MNSRTSGCQSLIDCIYQRLPGLAGELPGGQGGGPHAQDKAAELLRARLRKLFGGAQEERKEAGYRSGPPGACGALRAEFEGSLGKLGPLRERIRQTDELIDATVYRLYGLNQDTGALRIWRSSIPLEDMAGRGDTRVRQRGGEKLKVSIDWIIRKKVIDALAEKTDQILRIVDGKLVCELRRKGDGFVTSESCDLGEDDGKIKRAEN